MNTSRLQLTYLSSLSHALFLLPENLASNLKQDPSKNVRHKGLPIKYERKVFRKTNISNPDT